MTSLLKAIDRRGFKTIVARHAGDAYDKTFDSWRHPVALIFAQLTGAASLRAIVTGFNAQANHHYHLGCGPIARSTLSDANARRPVAVFADVFAVLVRGLGRKARKEGESMLRLIDSTPVPLSERFDCARTNGRIHGMKLHVLHDPALDCPLDAAITPANVNDIAFGRALPIEPGATYVFDKGYCHYGWWAAIAEAKAFFVTRPKKNARFRTLRRRPLGECRGDGFVVRADREVRLASKGDAKLPIFLRRITIKRDNGDVFDIVSNDPDRPARDLAACYKARWDIELFFKWIKQNLNIKKFVAVNENAVRLQILAAMIAFVLIRLAMRAARVRLTTRRFAELVAAFIHARRHIAAIEKPPPINPSRPRPPNSNQLQFAYA